MSFLTDEELAALTPGEVMEPSPIPLQAVSSDEYVAAPQSARQKEVEARLFAMGDELGKKQNMSRRQFFQTASGMAAGFVALNEVYGNFFDVTKAEASTPEMSKARAD